MSTLQGKREPQSRPAYANTGMEGVTQNKTTTRDNAGYQEAMDNNIPNRNDHDLADYSKLISKSSLPRPLDIIGQTNTSHRGSNRVANPYAVDETEDRPVVISKGIANDGYEENIDPKQVYDKLNTLPRPHFTPGEIYQTIAETRTNPVRKLSRKLKQSFKGRKRQGHNREMDPYAVDLVKDGSGMTMGISDFVYEDVNDDHSHQYADLGEAVPKKPELPSAATHPRRKPNKLYEPSGLKKKKRHESDIVGERNRCGCLRESRLIKLCLFVIVFLFLLCLFLIILLITGQLRVQTTGQQGKPSHQKSFSSEPLQKTVAELQTNITNMEALLLKFTRSNLETSIVKVMADMRALNETFRRSSQQQSFSLEPLKKTISELQANITKMEALLNEKKSDDNIQVPIVNGSVSVLDLQRHFDAKLNSTKDQLQAATGRIAEQMTAMNSSLVSKIQAVSLVQGVQGLPGFNGSDGSDGDSGRMGLQGLPGINGTRGPPGSGNFSQCQYKASTLHSHKQDKATSVSTNLVQPDGFIIIDASCSTIGTQEYNLEINVPVGGGNPNFICHCKGISTLFPSSDVNVYCTLHYLLCPKTT